MDDLTPGLRLVPTACCLCGGHDSEPIAVGEDFEYRTSADAFRVVRCRQCELIYLDPRPAQDELARIYPSDYHAFDFSDERFGFVFRVRRWLEAKRLLGLCRDLPDDARILDVGCGDGFHLGLLKDFGPSSWRLEGVDPDERAVSAMASRGLTVHQGYLQDLDLPLAAYDAVLLIQTVEHVGDPPSVFRAIGQLLKPGGRLIVVTDNSDSLDFHLFRGRYWGGYHFPRHWNLFTQKTLRLLAEQEGLEVARLATITSPVNWTYSVRNALDDLGAPRWLVERFSLRSPVSLALFTLVDRLLCFARRGALLQGVLRRPLIDEVGPRKSPAVSRPVERPVAILGGGFAGLCAAEALHRRDIPFVVYEVSDRLAGMADTFVDQDGFTYDFGAHFITNRLAAALGVGASCRLVHRYGESILAGGKIRSYPFGLMTKPSYLAGAALAQISRRAEAPANAEEAFQRLFGAPFTREITNPILKSWSGVDASQLSASVVDKVPTGIVETMMLTLARRVTGRAVAIGYCGSLLQSPNVFHVYPNGGLSKVCEALTARFPERIRLQSPVEEIFVEHNRVVAVRAGGKTEEICAAVNTLPVNRFASIVKGTDALEGLKKLRYRPMVFAILCLEGRNLLPNVMLWTLGARFPFFRLTEVPMSMPWLAPAGKTMITADLGCELGDETWSMGDEELGALCVERLEEIIPDIRSRYLHCRVLRTPNAYPLHLLSYEDERRRLESGTGIDGLYSIGRNGEFMHILMEDIYCRTSRQMEKLARDLMVNPVVSGEMVA